MLPLLRWIKIYTLLLLLLVIVNENITGGEGDWVTAKLGGWHGLYGPTTTTTTSHATTPHVVSFVNHLSDSSTRLEHLVVVTRPSAERLRHRSSLWVNCSRHTSSVQAEWWCIHHIRTARTVTSFHPTHDARRDVTLVLRCELYSFTTHADSVGRRG